jgi:hypothetical protein
MLSIKRKGPIPPDSLRRIPCRAYHPREAAVSLALSNA